MKVREADPSVRRVAPNGEQGHAATVYAPLVDDHRFELAGHARLEYLLLHRCRDADAVVNDGERAHVALSAAREKYPARMGVARVSQQLHDDVLDAPDVVLGLATLGFRDLEPNVAVAEVLLDLEEAVA